jgi:hypothetical protein
VTLVCPDCFGDSGLQRRIVDVRPDFDEGHCDFHPRKKGVPISAVAEIVDEVFRNRYTFGNYHPILDEFNGDDLTGTLWNLTEADDDRVIAALAEGLIEEDSYWPPDGEEPYYSHDSSYVVNHDGYDEHSRTWEIFRALILHEQRFFNTAALDKLREIFDGLHLLRSEAGDAAIYELGPEDPEVAFFRARKCNSYEQRNMIAADAASKLGPPPDVMRRPGRMNSSGILAFYGAFDLKTCIAELRPAVGETIIGAQFSLARPILVLDTTKFKGKPKAPNIFAKTHIKQMRLWKFMSMFRREIARPCLPEDEYLDYIPTQVVSEYLARIHDLNRSDGKLIDAIIYRSAQNKTGKNIAVFGEAGTVKDVQSTSRWTFRSPNPGLQFVEGSVASHKVTGVAHSSQEEYAVQLNENEMLDDEYPF